MIEITWPTTNKKKVNQVNMIRPIHSEDETKAIKTPSKSAKPFQDGK